MRLCVVLLRSFVSIVCTINCPFVHGYGLLLQDDGHLVTMNDDSSDDEMDVKQAKYKMVDKGDDVPDDEEEFIPSEGLTTEGNLRVGLHLLLRFRYYFIPRVTEPAQLLFSEPDLHRAQRPLRPLRDGGATSSKRRAFPRGKSS